MNVTHIATECKKTVRLIMNYKDIPENSIINVYAQSDVNYYGVWEWYTGSHKIMLPKTICEVINNEQ